MASPKDRLPVCKPRIIIHGGAGNLSPATLPRSSWTQYKASLLRVLHLSSEALSEASATALDTASYAVSLLEDDPLFNAGKGAVFTRAGTNELESSIMVSEGYAKRGVGCMLLRRVKNPILAAKELLVRGEQVDGGGAGAHCQLAGEEMERLAESWGLEMVEEGYFWTRRRWEEHVKGLERERERREDGEKDKGDDVATAVEAEICDSNDEWSCKVAELLLEAKARGDPGWDGREYLPQGTVGCVVLDRFGTLCVATSTGGLTNKLPGRIGDTPTLGAGFWAEQWFEQRKASSHEDVDVLGQQTEKMLYQKRDISIGTGASQLIDHLSRGQILPLLTNCLPIPSLSSPSTTTIPPPTTTTTSNPTRRAFALSGTGNGDSFLRTSAARTVVAIAHYGAASASTALHEVAGKGGELQRSAGSRWGKTGEGEGGMIGIEFEEEDAGGSRSCSYGGGGGGNGKAQGKVVFDYNCGGMFRAWIDEEGSAVVEVFRKGEGWDGE